jgi:hypothetical protein
MKIKVSRRTFIKRSAFATAGFAIANSLLVGLASAEEASGCKISEKRKLSMSGGPHFTKEGAQAAAEAAANDPNNWVATPSYHDGPCTALDPPSVQPNPPTAKWTLTQVGLLWYWEVSGEYTVTFCTPSS